MNPLNKKIKKSNTEKRFVNQRFHNAHKTYVDLKYYDWIELEDENGNLMLQAVMKGNDSDYYIYETCNIMNIPFKQGGKRNGKK